MKHKPGRGRLSDGFGKIRGILKEVQVSPSKKLIMLGASIFSSAVKDSLLAKHYQLLKMIDRFSYLNAHQAFFFFKNCLSIPKILFILRCSPSYREHAIQHLKIKHCKTPPPSYTNSGLTNPYVQNSKQLHNNISMKTILEAMFQ